MRLINLACSKIKPKTKFDGAIIITTEEFMSAYSINEKAYILLRSAVKKLMRTPIQLFDSSTGLMHEAQWITSNTHSINNDGKFVKVKFSEEVRPHLYDLAGNFTRFNFKYLARLNTQFSIRLYQWLIQEKLMNRSKKNGTINVEIDIDLMKKRSGIEDKYSDYRNFRRRVIEPAINQINEKTNISVTFKPIKKGHTVKAMSFTYIDEEAPIEHKPIRPKLLRRPRVVTGTHEDGEWKRKNIKLLLDYEAALKAYDPQLGLSLADLKKLFEYNKALGDKFECERLQGIINERGIKKRGIHK